MWLQREKENPSAKSRNYYVHTVSYNVLFYKLIQIERLKNTLSPYANLVWTLRINIYIVVDVQLNWSFNIDFSNKLLIKP